MGWLCVGYFMFSVFFYIFCLLLHGLAACGKSDVKHAAGLVGTCMCSQLDTLEWKSIQLAQGIGVAAQEGAAMMTVTSNTLTANFLKHSSSMLPTYRLC
jgi:hypothetical protein